MTETPNPETFRIDVFIMQHVADSHVWHLPFLPPIHLPEFLSIQKLMLLIWAGLLVLIFCTLYQRKSRVPTGMTNLLEVFIIYMRDEVAIRFLGEEDGRRMTPYICTLFFFILGLNLMGTVPLFSTTPTANLNVTGALAFLTFLFMTAGAMLKNGVVNFLKSFVIPGVPLPLLVLLTPLEMISVLIKSFALMIRLFANMLSGHIVILSLLGLIVMMGIKMLPMFLLAVFVSVLEIFVAFLQAYIFTFLSAIFIGQIYHPGH